MIRNSNKQTKQYQTYPDGWGSVYDIKEHRMISLKQEVVHFAEQTVGERRFWDAQVSDVQIVRAVLVPFDTKVSMGDLFVIGEIQYEIKQKQRYDRTLPASWLLSLSEAVIAYRTEEKDGE